MRVPWELLKFEKGSILRYSTTRRMAKAWRLHAHMYGQHAYLLGSSITVSSSPHPPSPLCCIPSICPPSPNSKSRLSFEFPAATLIAMTAPSQSVIRNESDVDVKPPTYHTPTPESNSRSLPTHALSSRAGAVVHAVRILVGFWSL